MCANIRFFSRNSRKKAFFCYDRDQNHFRAQPSEMIQDGDLEIPMPRPVSQNIAVTIGRERVGDREIDGERQRAVVRDAALFEDVSQQSGRLKSLGRRDCFGVQHDKPLSQSLRRDCYRFAVHEPIQANLEEA